MKVPTKEDLEIQLNHLETDCANQPKLVFEWATERAKALKKVKDLKRRIKVKNEHLKYVEAKVSIDARNDPIAFGLPKATDESIKAVVLISSARMTALEEVQILEEELVEAEHEEDMLGALMDAIQDRKDELRNEVLLHGQQYWSKVDTSGDQQMGRETREKAMQKSMRRGM